MTEHKIGNICRLLAAPVPRIVLSLLDSVYEPIREYSDESSLESFLKMDPLIEGPRFENLPRGCVALEGSQE